MNRRSDSVTDILNFLILADGFMQSSIELAKFCLIDNSNYKRDILIFPILTNANHGIELYLKGLNWTINTKLQNGKQYEGSHNIRQIYQTVESQFRSYNGNINLKGFEEATQELDIYLNELFDKTDGEMDFSRYTIDKKKKNHFYVDKMERVEIDLENFVERFEIIKEKLESLTDFMYYQELKQDF